MIDMFLKILLFLIAFLVGADELMLGPILAPIGKDLGVQPERVTLFITAYSLALALMLITRRARLAGAAGLAALLKTGRLPEGAVVPENVREEERALTW